MFLRLLFLLATVSAKFISVTSWYFEYDQLTTSVQSSTVISGSGSTVTNGSGLYNTDSGILIGENGNYLASFTVVLKGVQKDSTPLSLYFTNLLYASNSFQETGSLFSYVDVPYNKTVTVTQTGILYKVAGEYRITAYCGDPTNPNQVCPFDYLFWTMSLLSL